MQVVVIGSSGQTGHRIIELLLKHQNMQVCATYRRKPAQAYIENGHELDLEADDFLFYSQLERLGSSLNQKTPIVVVFAAAFTNVDGCEKDPEKCHQINIKRTIDTLSWAHNHLNAKLVFFSTDYVFDGLSGPYTEEHPQTPVSVYGKAKTLVENWLENKTKNSLIIRTTGVYDFVLDSKNFLMQILERGKNKDLIHAPFDQYSNPVWAVELAEATLQLIQKNATGIFHVAGGAYLSRVEFAKLILKTFNLDPSLISPQSTKELNQLAKRPLQGGLRCDKLKNFLGWTPAHPDETLNQLKESLIQ